MEQNNYQDEISLRELIEALLRQKKLIAIITMVSIILVGAYSFIILSPTYEASMMIMASSVNVNNTEISVDGNVNNLLDAMTRIPTMNVETYRQQIVTPEVLNKTITELGLGDTYTVGRLARKISLETVKDTDLIKIKVMDTDTDLAARIVNSVGDNFIQYLNENTKKRIESSSEYVEKNLEIEKEIYDQALLEQKELLSKPRSSIEVSMEMDALIIQLTEYKTRLNDLSIRREALNASIDIAKTTPGNGSSLIINQETGKVILDSSETTLRMELAEVESQLINIAEIIPNLENKVEDLRVEFQEKSHEENLITAKVDRAKGVYESYLKKYEELRVTESAAVGDASVMVVSRAYPTSTPVGPRKALNMAIALVLGLMVGVFVAFFIEYWKQTEDNS